jgi:2-hydroxy-6-oxonona-2,4-dienedioate hydrolase
MAEHLELKNPVKERPLSDWSTIAVELLGSQSRLVQGKRWYHHVIEKGQGPPLFLYHGIGGHAETYARTLPQLAENFHVYAVDMIFHGHSSKEGFVDKGLIDVLGDGVIDLMDALGYETINFEGESLGGALGVNVGFRYPERLDKMVLNGFSRFNTTQTFKPNPARGDLFQLSEAAVTNPTYENIRARLEWLVADPARIDDEMVAIRQRLYQDPEINASMRKLFNIGGTWDPTSLFPAYEESDFEHYEPGSRTLVLWGDGNPHTGYDYAEYCADMIGGKFYGVDDSGHWPQWEHPDEYSQVLTEFLQS